NSIICSILYRASPEEVRRALAAENWDMPVIVTTAVQFFESIYANRSSKCRKLHNLADSVIIFDEAQMLPLCHLRPCVAAMASLAEQFRSTLVLCTATQPSLGDLLHTYAPSYPITELCPQTAEEYDSFRRVTFRQEGILEDDVLAEKLSEHRQVLCIVNSRKARRASLRACRRRRAFTSRR
ncbi:MAG: CRISPR-associated helicase/endonuclease Cas3, partial [Christensenellales bacterium]